jgi:hypothetical protein
MRRVLIILATAPVALGLVAADAAAQPRSTIPNVRPLPNPPAAPGGFGGVPSPQQEIRVTNPNGGQTRILIEPGPATAGGPAAPGAAQGFGSVPSFTNERRIIVEDNGNGGRGEVLIQESGPPLATPIIILPILPRR